MKTHIFFIIILCFIITILGIVFLLLPREEKNTSLDQGKYMVENILLKEGFFHSYDFEDITINYSDSVYGFNDKKVKIEDLFHNKNSLAVFMSVGSCNCVYDNMEIIQKIKQKSNVVICIDGLSKKDFRAFVLQYNIEEISYLLPERFFDGFVYNPIVYFVIDRSLKAKYFYAPSMAFPELTTDYLQKINSMIKF